jgi:phosphoglycerate dehydrogenase-like enzyme
VWQFSTIFIMPMKERSASAGCVTAPKCKFLLNGLGEPSALRGFDALVANRERTRFSRALLEQLPDLPGNHVYHIDFDATEERGIIVAKATGGGCTSATELAIGLMIALMRQIPSVDREVKCGRWPTPMTRVLRGKTLGIIGLGYVGRHVTKIARAFEMNVLAWGPRLTPQVAASVGAESCEIDTLLSRSDIVSVHATLSPESRGLIDARRLALMRPMAYLINTARGPIVEEVALYNALASNCIAGAGLDVFDEEPLPSGHPLTKLPNVVLTSHLGWPTDEMYSKFADAAADALLAYLDGRDVPRFVARQ